MAMQLQSYAITADGYRQLRDELEHLSSIGRQRMVDQLREARQDGDLADNPALLDVLEQQAAIESRIAYLSQQLSGATIARTARNGEVGIGSFVTVHDAETGATHEYQLVAEIESDASAGKLSVEAPIGRALLGLREGAVASIDVPRGACSLEVVRVTTRPLGSGRRR
jgi:transcription elongation factor GreA